MELMQFTAIVLLTLLMLKLLLVPIKVGMPPVVGTARWFMTIGIALLDVQFLLQYSLGLRAMGVTQAVLVNLILFVPSSIFISLAIIKLQKTKISLLDKMVGGITWGVVLLLLGVAAAIDGQPLLSDTPELFWAEVISSGFYLVMQGHYTWRTSMNLRSMRLALQNYYDHDRFDMLTWMKYSIIVLMVMSMMVPQLIFVKRQELAVFGILFFAGIFYMVDSFCFYIISSAPKKIMKAEQEDTEKEDTEKKEDHIVPSVNSGNNNTENLERVDYVVGKWIEKGSYRQSGLTLPNAANEIGIPRYLLSAWLKQQGFTYTTWITELRIEEAKRMLAEHSDWNNEAIAKYCGFNDRSYFQKKFKEQTGLSPAEYITNQQ